MNIRTRFAPSPTGYLHVGGIRTALFAWLLARQTRGQFILRLEDTDKKREVEGSAEHVIQSLAALGLDYDEGPDIGGAYGPYRQSDRMKAGVYDAWAHRLLQAGRAYIDPYSPEELEALRGQAKSEKKAFLYREHRPEEPSLQWDSGMTLRFKSDPKSYHWHDEVMGHLNTGPEVVDDFILIKSDGYPTYNFAHIVDDAEMKITHVIRGQEFIASQPNYLNLYEALGLTPPIFATMPHILAPTGGKKLSKRDGAKDVLDYIRDGYLPEALVNFIASMGWNDGTEQEIFTRDELIATFSLARVQRSGARFDEQRLNWMNGQHIRNLSADELMKRAENFWPVEAENTEAAYKKQILLLVQDRLKTLTDLPALSRYFFHEPTPDMSLISGNKQLNRFDRAELKNLLIAAQKKLGDTEFDEAPLTASLQWLLTATNQKPIILFGIIRLGLTWAPFSPGLAETMTILGKQKTLERLQRAIESL